MSHRPARVELDPEEVLAHEKAVEEGHKRVRELFDQLRQGKNVNWELIRGVPGELLAGYPEELAC